MAAATAAHRQACLVRSRGRHHESPLPAAENCDPARQVPAVTHGQKSGSQFPGRSAAAGRRLVLLYHARRDAPARADRDAVVFRPGPDVTGALAARRGPGRPARLRPPSLPRVLDEWRQLLSERGRVLLAQIDLIVRGTEGEPHRLIRRAAIKVVFQRDGYSLSHLNLPKRRCLAAPYTGKGPPYSRNAADQA